MSSLIVYVIISNKWKAAEKSEMSSLYMLIYWNVKDIIENWKNYWNVLYYGSMSERVQKLFVLKVLIPNLLGLVIFLCSI